MKRFFAYLYICSLIVCLIGCTSSESAVNQFLPPTKTGVPSVYKEHQSGRMSGIDQILEYNSNLYLLNDTDGTIRVYDLEGNYIETITFHITSINGSFQEAVNGDTLYVIDRSSNVYIFRNGDFVEFIIREHASDIRIQHDFTSTSNQYVAFLGSVWKKIENGFVCIIPKAYKPLNYVYVILVLSVVPIIVFQLAKKNKSRKITP